MMAYNVYEFVEGLMNERWKGKLETSRLLEHLEFERTRLSDLRSNDRLNLVFPPDEESFEQVVHGNGTKIEFTHDQLEKGLWQVQSDLCDEATRYIDSQIETLKSQPVPPTNTVPTEEQLTPTDSGQRIQWHGTTTDFFRLVTYLEQKELISPKNRARFARFFLDQKGKKMPVDSSPFMAVADPFPDPETKRLIDDMSKKKV